MAQGFSLDEATPARPFPVLNYSPPSSKNTMLKVQRMGVELFPLNAILSPTLEASQAMRCYLPGSFSC